MDKPILFQYIDLCKEKKIFVAVQLFVSTIAALLFYFLVPNSYEVVGSISVARYYSPLSHRQEYIKSIEESRIEIQKKIDTNFGKTEIYSKRILADFHYGHVRVHLRGLNRQLIAEKLLKIFNETIDDYNQQLLKFIYDRQEVLKRIQKSSTDYLKALDKIDIQNKEELNKKFQDYLEPIIFDLAQDKEINNKSSVIYNPSEYFTRMNHSAYSAISAFFISFLIYSFIGIHFYFKRSK